MLLLAACGEAPVAKEGDPVAVHFTGTLDDGSVFDSSREREPLEFVIGDGRVLPGFDSAVRGMAEGDTVTVRLEPAEAYGEPRADFIFELPADQVPPGVRVGDMLTSSSGETALVIGVSDTTVTLDANHRLAGLALTFEIELVEIGDGS